MTHLHIVVASLSSSPPMIGRVSRPQRGPAHISTDASTGKLRKSLLLALLALALFVASSLGFAYSRLQGNIAQGDVSDLLHHSDDQAPRDPEAGHDYNILILGSDVRGENDAPEYTEDGELIEGMRSDTTMIVHLAADRSHVEVVSIPRDTLVDIPSCTVRTSATSSRTFMTNPMYNAQFNWAFSYGGQTGDIPSAAACTINTVEDLTGVRIDGYIVVDFNSFRDIVNALGGIPMYFEEDMKDSYSGLNVLKGCRLLDGNQALAFARARHNVGDGSGSDIGRIGRQQELVAAMLGEATEMNLFTDSLALYRTLDAGTRSLSTSKGLGDLTTLAGLAYSIREIGLENFHFITMPFTPAPQDTNRVLPTQDAKLVWKSLKRDKPVWIEADGSLVAPAFQTPTATPSAGTSSEPMPTATTESVQPTGSASASPSPTGPPLCTKKNALRPNYD